MKTNFLILAILAIFTLTLASTAFAEIPHLMNFQGKATDKAGMPLNGTYNLTFRIYNHQTAGTLKWTETQPNITITNGIFQVLLGSITPLNLPFDEDYWISVEVNTDGEMSPRTRLASVAYAYKAEKADSLTENRFVPSGTIMMWPTDTPPEGWFLCDGSAVSRTTTTYSSLFSVISTTYGSGDNFTTFNLPDLRGRFPLGKDNMGGTSANRVTAAQADNLGYNSGEENHTLTTAEMPSHLHGMSHTHSISHTHTVNRFQLGGSSGWCLTSYPSGATQATGSAEPSTSVGSSISNTASTGGGSPHNNMPPYITINYIIKY